MELELFRASEAERQRQRVAADSVVCREVAWQLVMLAERSIEHRAASQGAKVPIGEYRRWLALFAAGVGEPVSEPDPEVSAIFSVLVC